jgi:hypothetical protein
MKEKLNKSLNNETRKTNILIIKQKKNQSCIYYSALQEWFTKKLLYITTANYQNWNKKID